MGEGGDPNIVAQIVTGILTGGAGAVTTLLGGFRSLKIRMGELEESLGTDSPVKTGLFLSVYALEETVKRLKREVESWDDDPPKWAERLLSRTVRSSSSDLAGQVQFEERVERQLRALNERVSRAEDDMAGMFRRAEEDLKRDLAGKFVPREEMVRDSRVRAEEMSKVQGQLATVNGLLRGVMSAMDLVDPRPSGGKPRPGGR